MAGTKMISEVTGISDPPVRLEFVDALRGLAALSVICVHSFLGGPKIENELSGFIGKGIHGVQLFYFISAFTLWLSFSRRASHENRPVRDFLLRRFFRIAPLFYVALGFYLVSALLGWRLGDGPATVAGFLSASLFVNGWSPYWINAIVPGGWSVAIEMSFYVLVPFLFLRVKTLQSAVRFFLLALILSVLLTQIGKRIPLIENQEAWRNFLYFWLPNQLPVFVLGIIFFFLFQKIQQSPSKYRGWAPWLVLTAIYGMLALGVGYYEFLPPHILYTVFFLLLALGLALRPLGILVNPFTTFWGKISYSAYLVHFALVPFGQEFASWVVRNTPVLSSLPRSLPNTAHFGFAFLATVVLTAAIAPLTYLLIEKPGLAVGRRIIRRLEARDLPKPTPV